MYFLVLKMSKFKTVRTLMMEWAPVRSVILNAGGGKATMMALIIDKNYRVL